MLSRSALVWIGVWLIAAIAGFFGAKAFTIHQAPKVVMSTIEGAVAERAGGWNSCSHNRKFGPVHGGVKRANPDSVVTVMAYDLSAGPVRVSGETWPDYWSLSLYQQNSDNFFVINDRQLPDAQFDFVISLPEHSVEANGARRIDAPTEKGIMLIRRFIKEEADMAALLENQDRMSCGPLVSQSPTP
ncbi:MAG: DUF1254 domain-containing protein [Erythrobacter sp.]